MLIYERAQSVWPVARHSLTIVLLCGVSYAGMCAPVTAQDTTIAVPHGAQGEALFAAENYDAALAEFEAAYAELEGNPSRYLLLWNIGQCHERLFHYDRALGYYQRYLDEGGPEAEDRAVVEATMRALEGLLATVEINSNVPQAQVWIDGHEVGTAPGTIRVTSGEHRIEVRLTGYSTEVREVRLAVRESTHIDVTLTVVSDFRGLDSGLFWTSAGVAAAALIAGVAVGITALTESSNLQALGVGALAQEDRDYISSLALVADVLYGVAGLFAATSLVLAFLTNWDGSPSSTAAPAAFLAPIASPSLVGLAAWGRF